MKTLFGKAAMLLFGLLAASGLAPAQILSIVEQIDLKCYKIRGEPLDIVLQLDHLNPVLREMGLPPEVVRVMEPEHLCVPVAKNGQIPPDQILQIIQWLDLKCYRIEPAEPLNIDLRLDHLNPVLRQMGLPPEFVRVGEAHSSASRWRKTASSRLRRS